MCLRIAIISDLHCHPESHDPTGTLLFSDGLRKPEHQHPVQSLLSLIRKESLAADLVLLPGDITFQANAQGLISGWGFAREITAALGAEVLAPTLGNHDVDSRKTHAQHPNPFHMAAHFHPEFPSPDEDEQNMFWTSGIRLIRGERWAVLCINSAMEHFSEDECDHGSITETCLNSIRSSCQTLPNGILRIAMSHHHPLTDEDTSDPKVDAMRKGDALLALLAELNFSLFVHGHKHKPRLRYADGGSSSLTVFAAGSFSGVLSGTTHFSVA